MKSTIVLITPALLVLLFGFMSVVNAGTDEKAMMLKSSSFGNLKEYQSQKQDKDMVEELVVYEGTVMTTGNKRSLSVTYDEIWEVIDTAFLSASEIMAAKGKLNIIKLYWNDDKLQALTVDRYYETVGKHETSDIFNREYALKNTF